MKQREKIIAKLNADGEITSVWAMHNGIFRLSERIRELQEAGWSFSKAFVEKDGKRTHTFRYVVESKPKRIVYDEVMVGGVFMRRPRLV